MPYTSAQLTALKAELTTDPLVRGYSGMTDEAAANSLNTANRTVPLVSISPATFLKGMVMTEWAALTDPQRQYIAVLLSNGEIDIRSGSQIRIGLLALFTAGSGTRTNLLAMLDKTGSRAEELGFPAATPSDVADAKRLA